MIRIRTTEGIITLPSGETLPENLPKLADLNKFLTAVSQELSANNYFVGMNVHKSPLAWTILLYSKIDTDLGWEIRLSDGFTVQRFTREPYRQTYLAYKPRCSIKVGQVVRKWMASIAGNDLLIGLYGGRS